jgi:hypothetical protein
VQAVEKALEQDLAAWGKEERKRRKRAASPADLDVARFMEQKFGLGPDQSIFDILRALATPVDVTDVVTNNAIRKV